MGLRMREDNGWGMDCCPPVFMGVGCEQGGTGWVPACARTTGGDGFPFSPSRGQAVIGGTGMGSCIREDKGKRWIPRLRLHGGEL